MWEGDAAKPILADPGHELAPDGATDLLRSMLYQIDEFSVVCNERQETNTEVVWAMFNDFRTTILETLCKTDPPAVTTEAADLAT